MKFTTLAPRWVGMLVCVLAALFSGCATQGVDPWEKGNRSCYNFNDNLDKYALKPLSDGYVKVVPKPVRQCVSNGVDNLGYGNVILNKFLQGKWEDGWSDSGRMLVNSTIGVAGIFDVATPLGMVQHDTDFGITLGKWGVQQGPYLVLPLFGPSTARDSAGLPVGMLTDPTTWLNLPLYIYGPLAVLEAVDMRSRYEKMFKFRNAVALDPYVFTRNAYLQNRQSTVDEGKPQPTTEPSIFDEPEEDAGTQPAALPASRATSQPAAPKP